MYFLLIFFPAFYQLNYPIFIPSTQPYENLTVDMFPNTQKSGILRLCYFVPKHSKSPYFKPFSHYQLCTLVNRTTHSTVVSVSKGSSFTSSINRHREVEYNLLYPASVFSLFREHLNSLNKGFHKLFLFCFRCGMVDFIKCQ